MAYVAADIPQTLDPIGAGRHTATRPLMSGGAMTRRAITTLTATVAVVALTITTSAQQRPRIRTLTEQEVIDLTVGTAIQGTRSSDTASMIRQSEALLAAGKAFNVVAVDDLPDDWTIVKWLDGKPDILPPDLIYNLDPKTGDAVTGVSMGNYPIGKDVVIVGRAASPMWRTPKGLEIFSPTPFRV